MKEAKQSPYKPIFRETFNSESSVRKKGGVLTNLTFNNGVATFNSGYARYPEYIPLINNFSYEFRVKPTSFANIAPLGGYYDYGLDERITYVAIDTSGFIRHTFTNNGIFSATTGKVVTGNIALNLNQWNHIVVTYANGVTAIYVNRVVCSSYTITNPSAAITTLYNVNTPFVIGTILNSGLPDSVFLLRGEMDLCQLYKKALTASEVANLYNDTWNTEPNPANLLLDFNSTNGVLEDKTGKTLTPTDVSLAKIGQKYSSKYNGDTSKIDTGSDIIGTKEFTICGWAKRNGLGESIGGVLLTNGTINLLLRSGGFDRLQMYNGGDVAIGANNMIVNNKYLFFVVTRTSAGIANLYLGDLNNSPALTGSANQNTGSPAAGSTNVIIGNNAAQSSAFDGLIPMIKIHEGILSLQDITRIWSETKNLIGN